MPSAKLIQKLKPALQNQLPPEQDGILLCLDSDNVTGDNAKYMKMYNRLARWYDSANAGSPASDTATASTRHGTA